MLLWVLPIDVPEYAELGLSDRLGIAKARLCGIFSLVLSWYQLTCNANNVINSWNFAYTENVIAYQQLIVKVTLISLKSTASNTLLFIVTVVMINKLQYNYQLLSILPSVTHTRRDKSGVSDFRD